jgi:hypothetical protein
MAITTNAAYQPFAGGFMFRLGSNGDIYSFPWNGRVRVIPELRTSVLPDPADSSAGGVYAPVRGFGRVWFNYPDIQAALGLANAAESGYMASYQFVYNTFSGETMLFFTRPDGLVVALSLSQEYWYFAN